MGSELIHSTAIVSKDVELAENVQIGPYCVIEGNVKIANNVQIKSHVCISGGVSIGEDSVIFPFASIGQIPQDYKYKGENGVIKIGKNNKIRENVTISPGTEGGGLLTEIGDNNMLMIGCHVGHDSKIGNNCTIVNNVSIAGHVKIDDFVVVGGNSAVHQFVRIGSHVMIGGMSGVDHDIPPFAMAIGNRAKIRGLNLTGLRRRGFARDIISRISKVYEILFTNQNPFRVKLEEIEITFGDDPHVKQLLNFVNSGDSRNLAQWGRDSKDVDDI